MKLSTLIVGAVVVSAVAFSMQAQQGKSPLVGQSAPDFTATGTDGKTYSLAGVEKKAPLILAFWKNPCPHNARASALVNSIVAAYKGKVNVVGVVNSAGDRAKSFQDQFKMEYPFMADGEMKIIDSYKQERSITFVVIGKDKKIEAFIGGYSQDSMAQLNAAMAKAVGAAEVSLDFSSAPTRTTYG